MRTSRGRPTGAAFSEPGQRGLANQRYDKTGSLAIWSLSAKSRRARLTRLFTVPTSQPITSAAASYVRP